MIYVLIGLSILFIALGIGVTEKNAKHIISGYQYMDEVDKKNMDISFFKKFHIFLGVSLAAIGLILFFYVKNDMAWVFAAVYPIGAYIYLAWKSSRSNSSYAKRHKIGFYILLASLIFVIGLFFSGYRANKLSYDFDKIKISGSYGETFSTSDVKNIQLINELPPIDYKVNGFALSTVKKGYFKITNIEKDSDKRETAKLILNTMTTPLILFEKKSGEKIYFSAKEKSNEDIFEDMKKVLPQLMSDE
ncbi:MAG TPA: DUF3784 domain-containing protein [Phaeodactylibacter sp.]|nr:DUF3784 domain-containing protein [Phaeodactylibacter sp.]